MVSIKKASLRELADLQHICIASYGGNFADHWNSEEFLQRYLEQEFGQDRLRQDLNDGNIDYSFILSEGESIGFFKLNIDSSLANLPADQNTELEKIYILPDKKGNGIGKIVLNLLFDRIKKTGKQFVTLDVLQHNLPAKALYEKMGFIKKGTTRINVEGFKEELREMDIMVKALV